MSKTIATQHQVFSDLKSFDGDAADYRRLFEALATKVPFVQALLVTSFPRGGTQVLQPTHAPDGFLRTYGREGFALDAPTWQAILKRTPVTGNESVPKGSLESSAYYREVMEPFGLAHVAAARLADPVFRGYPGALHLYRKAGEQPFSASDLRILGQAAEELNRVLETNREARITAACGTQAPWERLGCCRQFIFDGDGQQIQLYKEAEPLDERLRDSIRQLVSSRIETVNGEQINSDRVDFQDSNGEVWAFRTTVHRTFPALGDGPHVFLCLQPPACEWDAVRATDFQADPEVARLVPTLKFMQHEFHRTPTLDEIAAKAHLSPFHFHRRFTELLGLTPKHFLLACQIRQAKRMLMERKIPLAEIAAKCGFAHQSHFTSRFKQATGLTPTRWRRFAGEQEGRGTGATKDAGARSPGCAV
jgi:AraC-like DNA-binding protein